MLTHLGWSPRGIHRCGGDIPPARDGSENDVASVESEAYVDP